jgi:hypothetical protein
MFLSRESFFEALSLMDMLPRGKARRDFTSEEA